MGAAPDIRPASRWQLLQLSWLPVNSGAKVAVSRKPCSPRRTASPNFPLGIELSGGDTKGDGAPPASLASAGARVVIQRNRAVAAAAITASMTSFRGFIVGFPRLS